MMNNSNSNNNNNNISNNNTNNNNNNKNNNNELLSPLPSLPFDTTMITTPSPHSTSSFTSSPETTIQDIWSPTATIDVLSNTWLNETNPFWSSGHQVSSPFIHSDFNSINQYNENDIDLWLQNGGDSLGCVPLVAATDQELADLLDFDMNTTC
ncbi:hypothetical protein BJ944DRAFT_267501 [Cunninghamella echinulata]|nr:hypothetical protein BJ944DRAFT_267501 [Cunninghamella echinulata]